MRKVQVQYKYSKVTWIVLSTRTGSNNTLQVHCPGTASTGTSTVGIIIINLCVWFERVQCDQPVVSKYSTSTGTIGESTFCRQTNWVVYCTSTYCTSTYMFLHIYTNKYVPVYRTVYLYLYSTSYRALYCTYCKCTGEFILISSHCSMVVSSLHWVRVKFWAFSKSWTQILLYRVLDTT